ncbi:hypothetical protein WA026_022901 [Henosepilachna vigintioctopunctata]|uniref:Uncharacterized protein n=1 Tax=Henosepilachna vigintioctopunctata TaxID=420089 RepID=A0AAW1TYQ1_9CUCU
MVYYPIEESLRHLFSEATELHMAAYFGDTLRARKLLHDGADVNSVDKNGSTPLHLASMMVYYQTVTIKAILEYKPQINLQDNYNQTPLNILVARARYNIRLLKLYLKGGADPNVADIYGHTSLHHMVMFPLANKAVWLRCIKSMISHEADVNSTDVKGNTALHIATKRGSVKVVDLLLEHHANINMKNLENFTPIEIAFTRKAPGVLKSLGKHLLVQYSLNMEVNKEPVKTILEMERFKEFWKKCNDELDQLKSDKIGETEYSYFHMMTLPTNRMSKIFCNEDTATAVIYYKTKRFKIYGRHLYNCLTKAMIRNYSVTIGTQFFKHKWPWMPEIIIDKITSFLSNEELDNLAKVVKMDTSHLTLMAALKI